jgi:hypothetical protein
VARERVLDLAILAASKAGKRHVCRGPGFYIKEDSVQIRQQPFQWSGPEQSCPRAALDHAHEDARLNPVAGDVGDIASQHIAVIHGIEQVTAHLAARHGLPLDLVSRIAVCERRRKRLLQLLRQFEFGAHANVPDALRANEQQEGCVP